MAGSRLAREIELEEKRQAEAMREDDRTKKLKKERTSAEAQSCKQLDYSTYLRSKAITKENRLEAYLDRPVSRKKDILLALGDKEMTARQVMEKLGYKDPNTVKPRIHELVEEGILEAVSSTADHVTGKSVAVYRRCDDA